jgi:hypothetical protein
MRAIFITSGKGGVAKTKCARLIGEQHREAGTGAVLVDADAAVGQFLKHLGVKGPDGKLLNPQPLSGVQSLDWHNNLKGRDEIANLLAHGKDVLFDMPGGSLDGLRALDDEAGYFDVVAASGYEATFVSMITPWVETWSDATKVRKSFPTAAHLLVVNHDFGDQEDFARWHESKTRAELLAGGSREIELPLLKSGVAAEIAYHRLRFHDAPHSPVLEVLDRGRAAKWLAAAKTALAGATDILGLPGGAL